MKNTSRTKPTMPIRIACLLDPLEWELIFIDLHDLFEEKDERAPSFINWVIVEPLESILLEEHAKKGFSDIFTVGMTLLVAARDAMKGIGAPDADPREPAWNINEKWKAWYVELARQRINANSETQSERAKKPRARDGVSPADREARNQAIIDHFDRRKHRLTANTFAIKYSTKYRLKPRRIREILSKTVGA